MSKYRVVPVEPNIYHVEYFDYDEVTIESKSWITVQERSIKSGLELPKIFTSAEDAEKYILLELQHEKNLKSFRQRNPPYEYPRKIDV